MSPAIWEVRHPLTGATSEHESLWLAVAWFAVETLRWLARGWLLPVLVLALFAGLGFGLGMRRVMREGRS